MSATQSIEFPFERPTRSKLTDLLGEPTGTTGRPAAPATTGDEPPDAASATTSATREPTPAKSRTNPAKRSTATAGSAGDTASTGPKTSSTARRKRKTSRRAAEQPSRPLAADAALAKKTFYLPDELDERMEIARATWSLGNRDWVRQHGKVGVSAFVEVLLELGLERVGSDPQVAGMLRTDGRRPQ